MAIGFYVPRIPGIPNTTPYRHAKRIGEREDSVLLVCEREPPKKISSLYPVTEILKGTGLKRKPTQIQTARTIVNNHLGEDDKLITGLGIGPSMAGLLCQANWIADIWDDPTQFSARETHSVIDSLNTYYQLKSFRQADLALITQHEESPLRLGKQRIYLRNGAPVDLISPGSKPERNPVQCIVAGKTRLRSGMKKTLDVIEDVSVPVRLDVFGEPYTAAEEYAQSVGINDRIRFHGRVPHDEVVEALKHSHIGFSLLPERRDLEYAYPLKVGEYLAAGVLTVGTPRRGQMSLTGLAGRYCDSVSSASTQIDQLARLSDDEYKDRVREIRERAEKVPWENELEKFESAIVQF